MRDYHRFYPPFMYSSGGEDFSDFWEIFCCKLLNIENRTTEICVRSPPEQGVDLFFPSRKIAYQCKSVESGKSGDFHVTNAVESIHAAQKIKTDLGWEKYVLCSNVDISGSAEMKLKSVCPDIQLFTKSYWVQLCEKNQSAVEGNFRRLVELPGKRVADAINNQFLDQYSDELKQRLDCSCINILLYCNRHDKVYRIPVSDEFTCNDLLDILRDFFNLPESKTIHDGSAAFSLCHSIVFNGKKIPFSKKLRDVGVVDGDLITYWTEIKYTDSGRELKDNIFHFGYFPEPQETTRDELKKDFERDIKRCFDGFDRSNA
ncbi:MAG: hypothetical protein H7836_09140 [Magnetococcus sp. YQC-3]